MFIDKDHKYNIPEDHIKVVGNYYTDNYKNPLEVMMYDILLYCFSKGVNGQELHDRIREYDTTQDNYDLKKIWLGFRKEIDEKSSKITAYTLEQGISALLKGH